MQLATIPAAAMPHKTARDDYAISPLPYASVPRKPGQTQRPIDDERVVF